MVKVLVGYFSRSGNTRKMAAAVSRGIKKVGVRVVVREVGKIKPDELAGYQAIILGSPTYYGLMAGEVKKMLDASVKIHGRLAGRVGGAFTSSGGVACGAETTLLSILETFLIHGMVVAGDAGAYHYGPAAVGAPDKKVTVACEVYGQKIARLAKRLFAE